MAQCSHCAAPLPKSGIFCSYCGTRNDIDLKSDIKVVNLNPDQKRICPLCTIEMQTINVGEKLPLYIERCKSCYGVFFDINELESMIESSVKGSRNVDLAKLSQITENPRHVDVITYRKCPVCQGTMKRKNFMGRSGVITDLCIEHGVWLDSGELRQIMEWVKSGGIEKIKEQEGLEEFNKKMNNARKKVNIKDKKSKDINTSPFDSNDKLDIFDALESFFFSSRF